MEAWKDDTCISNHIVFEHPISDIDDKVWLIVDMDANSQITISTVVWTHSIQRQKTWGDNQAT